MKSYKSSGVDIEAGDALVEWLSEDRSQESLQGLQKNLLAGIGGFASIFRCEFSNMKKPCLVTCTDGVGTKVKLASHFNDYSGVGQDLVAMCVNDLICSGATPLLFLDYYAVGQLELVKAKAFLTSVKQACLESECLLVGGETAEMPGVYQAGDFDCAGFAVGVVDEDKVLGAHRVQKGDQVLGISSSGFHSNGYSLLRQIFTKDLEHWKEQLLRPTALYVKLMKSLLSQIEIHAAAHITGGGIENIPRVLPNHLHWKEKSWDWPNVFYEVQKRTGLTSEEMLRTLNCGVGFVIILPSSDLQKAKSIISQFQFQHFDLGEIQ